MAPKTEHRDASKPRRTVPEILAEIRELAVEYYEQTGKPLGITAEIAEYEAAHLLGLQLADARQPGYDAWKTDGASSKKVQIKGRRYVRRKPGQRIGKIDFRHEWDTVMLVLLDEGYQATEIYEAGREVVEEALRAPGSRARNERGQLSVSKFKALSRLVWSA